MGIGPHGYTKRPRQAKICKLEVVALVYEKVLGFEVTMENSMGMAVKQSRAELVSEFLAWSG